MTEFNWVIDWSISDCLGLQDANWSMNVWLCLNVSRLCVGCHCFLFSPYFISCFLHLMCECGSLQYLAVKKDFFPVFSWVVQLNYKKSYGQMSVFMTITFPVWLNLHCDLSIGLSTSGGKALLSADNKCSPTHILVSMSTHGLYCTVRLVCAISKVVIHVLSCFDHTVCSLILTFNRYICSTAR